MKQQKKKSLPARIDWLGLLPELVIFLVWFGLVWTNYKPGTWLTGWDNLHPEFNFPVNLTRSLSATWQEYQGLGLLGGMGHASDFVRIVILWAVSFILPTELLRYFSTLGMLFIGALGMSGLTKQFLKKEPRSLTLTAATFASLFYMLNIGTVQNFYVPFEPFSWFFGMLPWLILVLFHYLEKPSRGLALLFFLISFLSTHMGYVQTVFVVYMIIMSSILFFSSVQTRKIKPSITAFFLTLFAHAFWLLPVIYFTLTNSQVTVNAKMNQLATPEVFYSNKARGNWSDVLLMKGFWFDLHDMDYQQKEFVYILKPWIDHFDQPATQVVAYSIVGLMVIGVLYLLFTRSRHGLGLTVCLLIIIFMMKGENPPLGIVVTFLRDHVPLFGQIFRNVFTKWVVAQSFIYSLFLGFGVAGLLKASQKVHKKLAFLTAALIWIVVGGGLGWYAKPAFSGNFIYPEMRRQIPQEYFELFSFFKSQPKERRILTMPIKSLWGWYFHDWGYRGSGFLWYGIEQPIVDRTFDVWSAENETVYNELSYAFYTKDIDLIKKLFDKYDIDYLLFDDSLIQHRSDTFTPLLSSTDDLTKELRLTNLWHSGSLTVFGTNQKNSGGFVEVRSDLANTKTESQYHRFDPVYAELGNYIQDASAKNATTFPFSFLTKESIEADASINFSSEHSTIELHLKDPVSMGTDSLSLPSFQSGEKIQVPVEVHLKEGVLQVHFLPLGQVLLKEGSISLPTLKDIEIPLLTSQNQVLIQISDQFLFVSENQVLDSVLTLQVDRPFTISVFDPAKSKKINLESSFKNTAVIQCWEQEGDQQLQTSREDGIQITTQNTSGCLPLKMGQLSKSGLLTVDIEYNSSDPTARPGFCLDAQNNPSCINADKLFYSTEKTGSWQKIQDFFTIDTTDTYWLNLIAQGDATAASKRTIAYRLPNVELLPFVTSYTSKMDTWNELKTNQTQTTNQEVIGFRITSIPISVDLKTDFYNNCDVFQRGKIEKMLFENSVQYSSDKSGALCDTLLLDGSYQDESYLLHLKGMNKEGRRGKIYVTNQQNQYPLIERLTSTKQFDDWLTIPSLSKENSKHGEYTLTFENKSFGQLTKSEIDEISLYPLPSKYLSNIQFLSSQSHPQSTVISPINTGKFMTVLYSVIADAKEGQVITLSQGYDNGWIAFSTTKPFQFLEHVKYNGWANGWIIEQTGEQEIVMLYWPQLLEFLGFTLLAILAIYIMILGVRNYREHFTLILNSPDRISK